MTNLVMLPTAKSSQLCREHGPLSPLIIPPLAPAEGSLKVLEFLLLSWHKIDAENVEANWWRCLLRQLAHILPGQPAEDVSLVRVHGHFGWGDVMGSPSFHF